MQTCSRCNTQTPDMALICPTCGAALRDYSNNAMALKHLQANPRVTKIRVVVANDCCPVCQSNEGVYDKDKVPPLPTPGCSHHNGCRCTYEPILDQIYP